MLLGEFDLILPKVFAAQPDREVEQLEKNREKRKLEKHEVR